jgi:hypothetical protein
VVPAGRAGDPAPTRVLGGLPGSATRLAMVWMAASAARPLLVFLVRRPAGERG